MGFAQALFSTPVEGKQRVRRVTDVLLAFFGVRLALWAFVVSTALPSLFVDPHRLLTFHDEHFWYLHDEAARISMAAYKQLPAWNPFFCGGVPLLGSPQDSSLAPENLLKLFVGVAEGRRLAQIILVVVGMEGFHRLARRHDASTIAAALGAIVFALCGFFLDVIRLGWINFVGFELLPWVVLCFYQGLRSWAWRVGGGLFVAWLVLQGGTYSVPYTVLVLAVLTALSTAKLAASPRRATTLPWFAPAMTFVAIGVVAVLASAVKLLPMLVVIKSYPRLWQAPEALPWNDIASRLLVPTGHDGQQAYVGGYVIALAFLGAASDRRGATFLGVGFLFFLFALGEFTTFAPSALLKYLPVFEQLRFPHRMVVLVAFFVCLAATRGLTQIEDAFVIVARRLHARLVSPLSRPAPVLAVGIAAIFGGVATYHLARLTEQSFLDDNKLETGLWSMDPVVTYAQPFAQSRGNRWDAQVWAASNRGSLMCFEETQFPQSAKLRGDLAAEEYPLDPAKAKVERVEWTPNAITLRVTASEPTAIVVNQNWAKPWRSDVGSVRAQDGLLAVDVPAGSHLVHLRFRDRAIDFGLFVSAVTWIAILVLAARELLRRGRAFVADVRADAP